MISYLEVGHVGDVCIPVGSDGLEGEERAGLPRHRRHLHRRLDVDLRLRLRLNKLQNNYFDVIITNVIDQQLVQLLSLQCSELLMIYYYPILILFYNIGADFMLSMLAKVSPIQHKNLQPSLSVFLGGPKLVMWVSCTLIVINI